MTENIKYAPKGFRPRYSDDKLFAVGFEKNNLVDIVINTDLYGSNFRSRPIDKDYFLKLACQAIIGTQRTNLNEAQAITAHLAGYDVADYWLDVWPAAQNYQDPNHVFNLHGPTFTITSTNGELDHETETVQVDRSELQALKNRIEELERGGK